MEKLQTEQALTAPLDATGIVLAGGASRRMGCDKALLAVGGVASIERVALRLREVCNKVLLSLNDPRPYSFLGLQPVRDIYTGKGPMAGLHACLSVSYTTWNAVAASDMPLVTADIIRALLRIATDGPLKPEPEVLGGTIVQHADAALHDAVIPIMDGKPQPLLAVYHRDVCSSLDYRLRRNELRMMDWLNDLNVLYVPVEELSRLTGTEAAKGLFNMNRPEDFETASKWVVERER